MLYWSTIIREDLRLGVGCKKAAARVTYEHSSAFHSSFLLGLAQLTCVLTTIFILQILKIYIYIYEVLCGVMHIPISFEVYDVLGCADGLSLVQTVYDNTAFCSVAIPLK